MSNQWRDEQNRYMREIERLQAADRSYMGGGRLGRNAQRLLAKQEPGEKHRLLNFLPIELHLGGWRSGLRLAPTV